MTFALWAVVASVDGNRATAIGIEIFIAALFTFIAIRFLQLRAQGAPEERLSQYRRSMKGLAGLSVINAGRIAIAKP